MATTKKAPAKPAAKKTTPAAAKAATAAKPEVKTAPAKTATKANTTTTTPKPKTVPKKEAKARVSNTVPAAQRAHYIEVAAFYIAERRGFVPGNPLADWIAAEAEIDRLLAQGLLG